MNPQNAVPQDTFRHAKLERNDSIRLLLLQPSQDHDAHLQDRLIHTTLAACRDDLVDRYTAISYVWGNPKLVETVIVDGKAIHITANLGNLLKDIRHKHKPFRIWVDALCINQKNIPERNAQVQLMGEIYSLAGSTIIYLGPLTADVDEVFDACAATGDPFSRRDTILEAAGSNLLRRPWFHRGWVFQEIVLSHDARVQCGRRGVGWSSLCNLLLPEVTSYEYADNRARALWPEHVWHPRDEECINSTRITRQKIITLNYSPPETADHALLVSLTKNSRMALHDASIVAMTAMYHAHADLSTRDLLSLLLARDWCEVSDPRDMIFSLMGIASDKERLRDFVPVDYNQTTIAVLVATANYLMKNTPLTLAKLVSQCAQSVRTTSLPSWVPTWGISESQLVDTLATTSTSNKMPRSPLEDVFIVATYHIKRTFTTRSVDDMNETVQVIGNVLPPPWDISNELKSRISDCFPRFSGLWTTPTGWFEADPKLRADTQEFREVLMDLCSATLSELSKEDELFEDLTSRQYPNRFDDLDIFIMHDFMAALRRYLEESDKTSHRRYRIAISSSRYFYLVPSDTAAGDRIVALGRIVEPWRARFNKGLTEYIVRPISLEERDAAALRKAITAELQSKSGSDYRLPELLNGKVIGLCNGPPRLTSPEDLAENWEHSYDDLLVLHRVSSHI